MTLHMNIELNLCRSWKSCSLNLHLLFWWKLCKLFRFSRFFSRSLCFSIVLKLQLYVNFDEMYSTLQKVFLKVEVICFTHLKRKTTEMKQEKLCLILGIFKSVFVNKDALQLALGLNFLSASLIDIDYV